MVARSCGQQGLDQTPPQFLKQGVSAFNKGSDVEHGSEGSILNKSERAQVEIKALEMEAKDIELKL